MQSLFKGSREKSLTAELTKMRIRASDLGREIADGEAATFAGRADLERMLHNQPADSAAIDRATVSLASVELGVKARLGALASLETAIADKERELQEIRDAQVRADTIKALDARGRRFRSAYLALQTSLTEFGASLSDLEFVPEGKALKIFSDALSTTDLPAAEQLVATLLNNYVAAVKAGSAAATLPQSEAPMQTAAPQTEAVTRATVDPVRHDEPIRHSAFEH